MERVLASGQTAAGPECRRLEQQVAALTGMKHAVGVDSGTSALMLALLALKVEHGIRRVGIPAYACPALLHAARAAGLKAVCMDCDENLRLLPEEATAQAADLDAVVLVHPFGMIEPMVKEKWPCLMVEDIAQAAGTCLEGSPLGGFGDISVVSFYATKPWGGACGGMVLSRDERLHRLACSMCSVESVDLSLPHHGNHRLSDIHAALAQARISMAADERWRRMQLARRYDSWLRGRKARCVRREENCVHYRYIVRVQDAAALIASLHRRGVGAARPVPVPLSRLTKQLCRGAEAAWRQCVSLPLLADLREEELTCLQEAVKACF